MYNEQLEKLIEMALMDGQLTDKEKQTLFKKAESFGVDLDEFEMYIDTKLSQIQGKSLKERMIKCPSCGEPISGLTNICPACKYVIESKSLDDNISLQSLVIDIENSLEELKAFPHPGVFAIIKANMHFFLIIIALLAFFTAFRVGYSNEALGFGFLIIAVIVFLSAIISFITKRKEQNKAEESIYQEKYTKSSFQSIKANFEKHKRLAKTYFGSDKNVQILISDLQNEINQIENRRSRKTKVNLTIYAVLAFIAVGILLIPIPKTERESEEEIKEKLSSVIFNISPVSERVNGSLANVITVVKCDYSSHFAFNVVEYLIVNNVKFKIIGKPDKVTKKALENNSNNLNIYIDILDENQMAVPGLNTLSLSLDEINKLTNSILSGSGEVFVNFHSENAITEEKVLLLKNNKHLFSINTSIKQ